MKQIKQKKQKIKEEFYIYDENQNRIASYLPSELPIDKNIIVEKSIYFFDDANPCYIHENAVLIRLQEEIKRSFRVLNQPIFINSLPKEIKEYLNFGEEVFFIEYCSDK